MLSTDDIKNMIEALKDVFYTKEDTDLKFENYR